MARASLIVQVGRDAQLPPFDLVEDDDLPQWKFRAQYESPRWWHDADLRSLPVGSLGEVPFDRLLSYGSVPVRLYTDAPTAELIALDGLSEPEPVGPKVSHGGYVFTVGPSGYAGRQVVPMGARAELRREALQFAGDTERRIRYWSGATEFSLRSLSEFRDAAGNVASPPALEPGGWYRSDVPVHGGLLVQYVARYLSYRIFYDVPRPFILMRLGPDGKVAAPLEPQPVPMTLFARAGQRVTTLTVQREYGSHIWSFGNDSGLQDFDGTEVAREEVEEEVTDPTDPANSVTVRRVYEVTLLASDGRVLRLRLNKDPGGSPV